MRILLRSDDCCDLTAPYHKAMFVIQDRNIPGSIGRLTGGFGAASIAGFPYNFAHQVLFGYVQELN